MAASYVLVTLAVVIIVEAVLIPSILSAASSKQAAPSEAAATAKRMAATLEADPGMDLAAAARLVPMPEDRVLAVLDTERHVAFSFPKDRYDVGAAFPLPIEQLNGKVPDGGGVWSASPILSELTQVGWVYVQLGQAEPGIDLGPLLDPGLLVLVLAVPAGMLFGLLSTRRLITRVRRLAEMTAAVAAGDYARRVPVAAADEVGRLEDGLNQMTERLDAAVRTERRAAGQEERARIARELHDSISQDLFSLSLLAAGMRKAAPGALKTQAESMERTSARAMREMQALLLELRPIALEDQGLTAALTELCEAYESRLGVRVVAELAEQKDLSRQAEHAILRLVQEALGNAVRHADPTTVTVRLSRTGVEIDDDGIGFDPADSQHRHGMGLRLMRERVEELGGTFELGSVKGQGTRVRAMLP